MSRNGAADTPPRDGEKQSRAAERKRGVRVIDAVGRLVRVIREPEAIDKHLLAPNALPIRNHSGRLCAIQLSSLADDRGEPGERYGCSLIPTERCKNDWGDYIGPPIRLKHKDDKSEDR